MFRERIIVTPAMMKMRKKRGKCTGSLVTTLLMATACKCTLAVQLLENLPDDAN